MVVAEHTAVAGMAAVVAPLVAAVMVRQIRVRHRLVLTRQVLLVAGVPEMVTVAVVVVHAVLAICSLTP
jgi:hypothetical protein